jgi:hypothetical protein
MFPDSPTASDIEELLTKMIPADHYMLESVEDLGFCARPIVGCDCCHRKLGGNYYEIMSGRLKKAEGEDKMNAQLKPVESYTELKKRQQNELNEFEGIFFAYNNDQFAEGMIKVGYDNLDNPKDKIYSLGAGGYIRKDRSKAFHAMFERHAEERKQRNKDEQFLVESIAYELANHEYCITRDVTDALNALGLSREELPQGILKKAISRANRDFRK